MANDKVKLAGHRKAIREHIDKYNSYPHQQDKDYALKTIRNVQREIQKILERHPHWEASYEDTCSPPF